MNGNKFSFQVDAEIVKRQRVENGNFVIDYTNLSGIGKKKCAIYFSSNDIYFPNTDSAFKFSILEKNHYEWTNCRITSAQKHIFLRDVNKQWYLSGINDQIDTPDKLLSFLKAETEGFGIVTVGSSAGGYAAILYGILLGATQVMAFNAQLEINSLLETDERRNPLIFRLKDSPERKYYDLMPLVKEYAKMPINYFVSVDSPWDQKQICHLKKENAEAFLNIIRFKTNHHGIPFPKVALKTVLNEMQIKLADDSKRLNYPLKYSIYKIVFFKTVTGMSDQLYHSVKKIIKRKFS